MEREGVRGVKTKEEVSAYNKAYKAAHREELAAKARTYYQENKDRIEQQKREYNRRTVADRREARRRYAEENRERLSGKAKAWRSRNREKLAADKLRYYLKNKDREDARVRQWRSDNRDLVRSYWREWYYGDLDHARSQAIENQHRRRSRLNGRGVTRRDWEEIKELFGYRCAYCGLLAKLEQEHVDPIIRGGVHAPDNVVPACRSCNARKNDKTLLEWLAA